MAYDLSDEEGLPASLQQHSKVVFRYTAGRKRLVPLVNLKGLEVSEDFGVIGMAWVEPRHLVAHPGTTVMCYCYCASNHDKLGNTSASVQPLARQRCCNNDYAYVLPGTKCCSA